MVSQGVQLQIVGTFHMACAKFDRCADIQQVTAACDNVVNFIPLDGFIDAFINILGNVA